MKSDYNDKQRVNNAHTRDWVLFNIYLWAEINISIQWMKMDEVLQPLDLFNWLPIIQEFQQWLYYLQSAN